MTGIVGCRWLATSIVLNAVMVLLSGCGGGGAGVDKPSGGAKITVTYGGMPVTEGRVDLLNEATGEGGGADLRDDGTANLENVVRGNYTVTVTPPPPANSAPAEPEAPPPALPEFPNIPEKFRRAATSPLRAEVKEGTTEYSFDLKE